MSRTWIKLKRGLVTDPKHRKKMGNAIWLYSYMLDVVDWDTGTFMNWKDEEHAEIIDMEITTFRRHRRTLNDEGYITAHQHRTGQDIIMHNYTNPREYAERKINKAGVDINGDPGSTKMPMPTSSSQVKSITIPKTVLASLRKAFSEQTGIPQPRWSSLSTKERKKYGGWWNTPLKTMWIAADQDEEKATRAIIRTCKAVNYDVYAPVSIEKAFYKYLKEKDDNRGYKRA